MRKSRICLVITGLTITIISVLHNYALPIKEQKAVVDKVEVDSTPQPPKLHYGFAINSLDVATGKVKSNQNLSEILMDFNISYQDVHLLSQRAKEVYDVRKLKAGAIYSIIHESDSLKTAHKFIFEPSPKEYVVYNLKDSIYAEVYQKPIEVNTRTIAAEIGSSLYNSIIEQDASLLLVEQMVDIFAWQVDFFKIAKGDRYKLIFEEETVEGEIVGIKNIQGAYFEHWKKEYYAIPFNAGEKNDYYDEEGNSLRRTFLKSPLNYSRISSKYSLRRFHPVHKRYKAHLGTDYAAPKGTPIRTVGDGVILEARYKGGNGNYVKIRHNSNYTTQYLHMSKIERGIRPGVKVKQGKTIGYVGSTGLANGPHLCFRFWKNGRQVDALKIDLPPSKGIDSTQIAQFRVVRDSIKTILDGISMTRKEPLLAKMPNEKDK